MMPAIGGHKMGRSSYLLASILKVYIESLTGFSHEYHSDGLNNTFLSEGCFSGWNIYSKDMGGGPITWVQSGLGSTSGHVLSLTSSNMSE